MKTQRGVTSIELFVLVIMLLGIGGWIANIVKFIWMLGDGFVSPMMIARGIGIFAAPFGAIIGFF
jgi:hypothetical protein